ncbi:hypothetical protein COJ23_25105 [Priestia megaterium]|uniref:ATP-binding protein n=1 Tax=Priestia megaterium TaxID=1404 RepID=UPI000BF3D887|nr:ATP-binding protein [Priestia megaterium]PFK43442.1 hypothetical protein COJ23_25105 [Priestia megaterium]
MEHAVKNTLDLTEYCNSYPKLPEDQIFREFYIRNLVNTFSESQRVIMLEGSNSTGKTVLLAQFAKFKSEKCISFFVGNDYWSSNLYKYLSELCRQMQFICSPSFKKKLEKLDIDTLHEHELKTLFNRLYSDLLVQAKQNKGPFYIVIDGLEKIIERDGEENLLDYIPQGDPEGVYVLLSSNQVKKYEFEYTSLPIAYFSDTETEKFLTDFLNRSENEKVYAACEGMPGYLREIKRNLENGTSKKDILSNLPLGFNNLLEKSWNHVDQKDIDIINILSLLTYSNKTFNIEEISEILDISSTDISLKIKKLDFLQQENSEYFVLNSYKHFLESKLSNSKISTSQKLISYYEKNASAEDSLLYLPDLYKQSNQYSSLVNLINVESLVEILKQTFQTSLVRRNLRILSDMSFEHEDWQRLIWSALAESIFTRIITNPSALEVEVQALLAIDEHETALKRAYDCVLPEDRLLLLAKVCNYMQKNKIYISEELIDALKECIELIDSSLSLNDDLIDKLIEISANLFPLKADLALKLLKRIAQETGENHQDSLMDFLLVKLLLKLDPNEESFEQIKDEIENDSIHEFAKATSTLIGENTVQRVLEQVDQLLDVSAKIFYLQSWCELNKEHPEAYRIIQHAINIMIESENYTPTQLHMRQISEPLLYCKDQEISKELVNHFDNLMATIIKNPMEEYAKLALILAMVQRKWSINESEERFYEVYILLDEIKELDTKCMVLVQLLKRCKSIIPEEPNLVNELRDQLIKDFNRLLNSSADHFKISKRIIKALSIIDFKLAYTFALKVNTQQGRYHLSLEILRVYIRNNSEYDFNFIESVLNNIKDKYFYDWTLVHILKELSRKSTQATIEEKSKYWTKINNIDSFINKSYAYSFYLVWISNDDFKKCNLVFNELKKSISLIDSITDKLDNGLKMVSIISRAQKGLAKDLFEEINQYKQKTSLSDERLRELFIETCELLVRMIPDLVRSENYNEKVNNIVKAIMTIPSSIDCCILLSNLALRCLTSGKEKVFKDIVTICLDLMDKCEDPVATNKIFLRIAPSLFEYERELVYERLKYLPIELQDNAIYQIVKFIFSKRPPEDPIDLESIQRKIDYSDALKVCDLLVYVNNDVNIYTIISYITDALIERSSSNKIKGILPDKQILRIADKLIEITNKKLPDSINIKHEGFKIAAFSCINKLREATSYRTNNRWNGLLPSQNEIKEGVLKLSNSADKTYVLSIMAKKTYQYNQELAISYLKDAEKSLQHINNYVDRTGRYKMVAEAYNVTSNVRAAKYLVEQAMANAELCLHEQGRDQLIGGVVELAHTIDDNLASNLASKFDKPSNQINIRETLTALSLHSDPKKIDNIQERKSERVYQDVLERVLKSICSGRGIIQHDNIIGKWMKSAIGFDYNTIYLCASWYIENFITGRNVSKRNSSELNDLYSGTIQLLSLIQSVDEVLSNSAVSLNGDSFFQLLTGSDDLKTYVVGQGEEAFSNIKTWLSENVSSYVKIYDPYFDEQTMELLKYITDEARITILTSAKTTEISDDSLQNKYKSKWLSICDQLPPETHFHVFATPNGKTPMHDRFIISDRAGIQLGTSLNGFGKRDSTIRYLKSEEKVSIENNIINSLLIMPPATHDNQKLSVKTFTLLNN